MLCNRHPERYSVMWHPTKYQGGLWAVAACIWRRSDGLSQQNGALQGYRWAAQQLQREAWSCKVALQSFEAWLSPGPSAAAQEDASPFLRLDLQTPKEVKMHMRKQGSMKKAHKTREQTLRVKQRIKRWCELGTQSEGAVQRAGRGTALCLLLERNHKKVFWV